MQSCTCSSMPVGARTAVHSTLRLAVAVTHPSGSLASPEGTIAFTTDEAASFIYMQHQSVWAAAWEFENGLEPKQGAGTLAASCHATCCFKAQAFYSMADRWLEAQCSRWAFPSRQHLTACLIGSRRPALAACSPCP